MQRVQTLRSSITGWRPVAGTRQPGELYVNWADAAFGTIDVTQTAMDLVAVRYWSAAANYAVGSHVIYNGTLYKALVSITAGAFNPAQWVAIVAGAVPEAPLDGRQYGRQSAAWTVVPASVPEAPNDGQLYGRQSLAWSVVASGGGIPEAPNDGQQYGRQSHSWTVVATGAGIPDAPNDGTAYARKSAAWSHLTHSDITDWTATLNAGYLPLAGGTMSGQINTVTPTAGSNAANKAYVDAAVAGGGGGGGGANIIDNGDMSIQQRAGSSLVVPSGGGGHILVDRWAAYSTTSALSIGQNFNTLLPPPGFANFLGAQCTSASPVGSTDYFTLQQGIEGVALNGFNWGAAGAQSVVLSFWACCSTTGTFTGALVNGANNRTYAFVYTISGADTPNHITIPIPGDTAGTWNNGGPNAGMYLIFDLGSGASNHTSATTWTTGGFAGRAGSTGIMGPSLGRFYVTGVKLELGASATPFVYDPPAVRLARCQRYYQPNLPVATSSYGTGGDRIYSTITFPVSMRTVPTVAINTDDSSNSSAIGADAIYTNGLRVTATISGSGNAWAHGAATCNAEI